MSCSASSERGCYWKRHDTKPIELLRSKGLLCCPHNCQMLWIWLYLLLGTVENDRQLCNVPVFGGGRESDASWDLGHFQYWLKGWKTPLSPRLDCPLLIPYTQWVWIAFDFMLLNPRQFGGYVGICLAVVVFFFSFFNHILYFSLKTGSRIPVLS